MKKKAGGWNMRVVKTMHKSPIKGKPPEAQYAMHEVYYEKGKPVNWTEKPMDATAEDYMGLVRYTMMMMWAFEKPVLIARGNNLIEEKENRFWQDQQIEINITTERAKQPRRKKKK